MRVSRVHILLVEDNPVDARITESVFTERYPSSFSQVRDGVEAMAFLRREGDFVDAPRPDLVLLDLNLPKKDGRKVLAEMKADPQLRRIPVVVLTTTQDQKEVHNAYDNCVNCFVTKPTELEEYTRVLEAIADFWLNIVELPQD
jgi:chemotaxis family two-component system response regulator Rcp1